MFEEIEQLVPQRAPFLFVDGFWGEDLVGRGHAYYRVKPGCVLLRGGATLSVGGLLEHMAQSVAAYSGYRAAQQSRGEGGGVKFLAAADALSVKCLPSVGDRLDSIVESLGSLGSLHLFRVTTFRGGRPLASVRLKVADAV